MKMMRWITIFVLLMLVFPLQPVQAKGPTQIKPSISITPGYQTTTPGSTVFVKVNISSIPYTAMHCVKVTLIASGGFKVYPSGYRIDHLSYPTTLDFKLKAPYKAARGKVTARVSWSNRNSCRGIIITNYAGGAEVSVLAP